MKIIANKSALGYETLGLATVGGFEISASGNAVEPASGKNRKFFRRVGLMSRGGETENEGRSEP
jgi:hypothetical protein